MDTVFNELATPSIWSALGGFGLIAARRRKKRIPCEYQVPHGARVIVCLLAIHNSTWCSECSETHTDACDNRVEVCSFRDFRAENGTGRCEKGTANLVLESVNVGQG